MITFGGGLILEQSLFVELISREVTPAVNSIFNPKIHYRVHELAKLSYGRRGYAAGRWSERVRNGIAVTRQ